MTGPTQGSMFLMRHLVRSQMSHGGERARCFLVTFPARFTLMGNFGRKDPNVGDLPGPRFTMTSHRPQGLPSQRCQVLPVPVRVLPLGELLATRHTS